MLTSIFIHVAITIIVQELNFALLPHVLLQNFELHKFPLLVEDFHHCSKSVPIQIFFCPCDYFADYFDWYSTR